MHQLLQRNFHAIDVAGHQLISRRLFAYMTGALQIAVKIDRKESFFIN
jgi:hypothetical protein